jgi:undecaprenyl-diphosphatase
MDRLDEKIFRLLYGLSNHSSWTDSIIIGISEYFPIVLVFMIACALLGEWVYGKKKKAYGYLISLVSGVLSLFVAQIIHYVYHHSRPFVTLKLIPLFEETSYSFPSSHAIFLFSVSMGVYLVSKKFGQVLFILSSIVCLGRVIAGVHYPSDILGGALLGVLISYIIFKYEVRR